MKKGKAFTVAPSVYGIHHLQKALVQLTVYVRGYPPVPSHSSSI